MNSRSVSLRLLLRGLFLWAVAAGVFGFVWLTFGGRPAYIHVRWAPDVTHAERVREEETYGLRLPEFKGGRTWSYALTDVSGGNVRALVGDPAVEDTQNINRVRFRPGLFTPRLPYRTAAPWIPAGLNGLGVLFLLGGALVYGLVLLELAMPAALFERPRRAMCASVLAPRTAASRLSHRYANWLNDRIPAVSPESAALFRIVFGSALVEFFFNRPVLGAWAAAPQNTLGPLHQAALGIFTQAPWIANGIRPWLLCWGVLLIGGAMTRTSLAMLTAGALAWGLLYTTRASHHTVSALLLTLVFLQGARWGDAWSVDAWRRRTATPRRCAPQQYGYAVWLPACVLGVVFAAAAFAKVREGGVAWILNGTVKYHFLSDSRQAMVDWGLRLGHYPWVAVLLSLAAIAVESLVIVGVISRAYRYRLVAGLAALSLLLGFWLFQGLLWPAWWILLLSFLPWHLIAPARESPPGAREASKWRLAVPTLTALVVLQLVITTMRIEVAPLLSSYDMYSTTYVSPAEYEAKSGVRYWIVASANDQQVGECLVNRSAAESVSRALVGNAASTASADVLERCFGEGAPVRTVTVEGRRSRIDWNRWPPEEIVRQPMAGPTDLP